MRFNLSAKLASALLMGASLSASALPRAHRGPTAHLFNKHMFNKHSSSRPVSRPAAQRAIAPERATQIQAALIKSGYLASPASGTWDATTQSAMEKFQADNGWQTKLIPDSRAIIKLGLGSSTEPASADLIHPDLASPIPDQHNVNSSIQ